MKSQEATMEYQTDSSEKKLLWKGKPPGSRNEDGKVVYSWYKFSPYFAHFCKLISGSVGEYNIRINASEEAAHRYTCIEPGTLNNGSAELIVLSEYLTPKESIVAIIIWNS